MVGLIELKDVSISFGSRKVLSGVSLKLTPGEVLGIMGGSGAGKTTLLRIMLGLYKPTSGQIVAERKLSESVGYASQEDAFYPRLTIEENLHYFGSIYGLSRKQIRDQSEKLLRLVKLSDSASIIAGKISGGMKRRLGIAIALMHDPKVLILDEPTAGLDVVLSAYIWSLVNKIKKSGKTIIISTHNLEELSRHCTTYVFIFKGKIYDKPAILKAMKRNRFKSLREMFVRYQN